MGRIGRALVSVMAQDPRIQRQLDKRKDDLARDLWVDETTRILADMKKPK